MIRDILLTAGVVLAAAILLGIGIGLGWWSRRDEIDALDYRIEQQNTTIGERIADVTAGEKAHAEIAEELAYEWIETARLRGLLAERKIGANPIWSQLHAVQPPPIPDEWLRWTGSEAGHTGQWRIPDDIVGRVELLGPTAAERLADNVRNGLTPDGHTDATARWDRLNAAGWVPGTGGTGLRSDPATWAAGYPARRPVDTALSDTGTFTITEPPEHDRGLDAAIERYAGSLGVVIDLGEEDVVTQAVAVRRGGQRVPVKDYPAKPQRHGKKRR